MSRIHEALKKAEEERAVALQSGALAAPAAHMVLDPAVAMDERAVEQAPGQVDVIPPPMSVFAQPAPMSDYLRFDDIRARCVRPGWKLDPNVNVFFNPDLSASGAEQFRTLRSRLYQLRASQPLRTLLVTSSIPAEGKTFVTVNLAQAIVRQPDRRALIIDADLRCSRLHVPLGAPVAPGLSDYLRGEADEMAVIQHGDQGNLCLIAGGNEVTNPSELLLNGRLKMLLDRVSPVFDWVILDSPPCLPVADASLLADLCDGVLFVVKGGSTPAEIAQKSSQNLQGRNVIGVVLNSVEESRTYGAYYYQDYGRTSAPAKK
ncbi:MAG TPA: CpsD/CapB family tyrosine-protein kinase [Candidatus Acidoferrales bacterium]|nr:CpsD/CapB family tyrosine-protein kinase [Candidatus Acidoferrales bacterium]